MYNTLTAFRPLPRRSYDPFTLMDAMMKPFFDSDRPAFAQGIRTDIRETPQAWLLTAELPGVKPADIRLQAENDVLTIEADVNSERRDEKAHYVCTERRTGHVSRSFSLEGVSQEGITAAYENGVLRITLPKAKPAEVQGPRAIAITGVSDSAPVTPGEAAQA